MLMPIAVKFCGADDGTKIQSEAVQYRPESHEIPHKRRKTLALIACSSLGLFVVLFCSGCLTLLEFSGLKSRMEIQTDKMLLVRHQSC